MFGTETVAQIVDEELSTTIGKKKRRKSNGNAMQELVFAAASRSEISLDGVYTLLRRDPTIILRECHVQ